MSNIIHLRGYSKIQEDFSVLLAFIMCKVLHDDESAKNLNKALIETQERKDVKEWTKTTAGYRDIPLTKEAQRILEKVAAYNQEHGFTAEWILQSSNPDYDYRLGYNAADRKLRKLCRRLDTAVKSPHKCRKTCLSALLDCPDVNNRTVQRFAGHQDLSTTFSYYSFERRSREEQAAAIDKAFAL